MSGKDAPRARPNLTRTLVLQEHVPQSNRTLVNSTYCFSNPHIIISILLCDLNIPCITMSFCLRCIPRCTNVNSPRLQGIGLLLARPCPAAPQSWQPVNVPRRLCVAMSSRACRGVQLADYRHPLQRHHFGLVGAGPFRSSICHDIGAQRILGEPRLRLRGVQRLLG